MAEHPAVNRRVVSSSLTCGANFSQRKRINREGTADAGREFPLTFPLGFLKRREKAMKNLYVWLRRLNPGLKNWLRGQACEPAPDK